MKVSNKFKGELPEEVKVFIIGLRNKYKYGARSTDFWEMFKYCLGLDSWTLLDPNLIFNGFFDTYLMDCVRDFISGEEIELNDINDKVLEYGEFTMSEKKINGEIKYR